MLIKKLLETRRADAELTTDIRAALIESLFAPVASLVVGAVACSIIGVAVALRVGNEWLMAISIGIFAAGMFAFLLAWDEFMYALIFTSSNASKTVPVAITEFSGRYSTDFGLVAAGGVLAALPMAGGERAAEDEHGGDDGERGGDADGEREVADEGVHRLDRILDADARDRREFPRHGRRHPAIGIGGGVLRGGQGRQIADRRAADEVADAR